VFASAAPFVDRTSQAESPPDSSADKRSLDAALIQDLVRSFVDVLTVKVELRTEDLQLSTFGLSSSSSTSSPFCCAFAVAHLLLRLPRLDLS
jgi:hypothetical protein